MWAHRSRTVRRAVTALAVVSVLGVAAPSTLAAQEKDIVETAIAAGSFTTLTKALTAAGLVETLQGPGPFTVFAPTDAAFAKLPKAQLDALLANREALKGVLLYHVVPGRILSSDAVKLDGRSAKMVSGDEAKITVMGGIIMVNQAHVTKADIETANGIIHIIDAVILPPSRTP